MFRARSSLNDLTLFGRGGGGGGANWPIAMFFSILTQKPFNQSSPKFVTLIIHFHRLSFKAKGLSMDVSLLP